MENLNALRETFYFAGCCTVYRVALLACENNSWSLHHWRENGAEVDLVLDRKNDILPIEIKYRKDTAVPGLTAFLKKHPDLRIHQSVVLTKDKLDEKDGVLYIPFWLAH